MLLFFVGHFNLYTLKSLIIPLCAIFLIISTSTEARTADTVKTVKDTTWTIGGENSITFSQVSLSNWAAGGENSLSANGFLRVFANKKNENNIWENQLKVAYGLVKQGEYSIRKSNDAMQFTSTYGRAVFKKWYLTAAIDFKSQFSPGYKYPNDSTIISDFLAPGYILASIGLDYKPNNDFSISLSPVSSRTTVVLNDSLSASGKYGVDPGDKIRFEFVGTFKMMYKTDVMKNVSFRTNLELLSNYMEEPENIDVDWEVFINMKINKYLSANISTHLIYDNDVMIKNKEGIEAARVQFKELFGIGFAYKFQVN